MLTLAPGPPRITAPFGRRAVTVGAVERRGAYTVLRCSDPAGPRPRAGQFYMLSSVSRWGGGEGERPFLPRAFSVLRAPAADEELHFLLEAVGPGTARLCEVTPGEELWLVGPLGNGFTAPEGSRRPILVGGGVGIAPLAILQDQLAEPPAGVLLGFRDHGRAQGAKLLDGARVATDDGSVGHHGLVTELLIDLMQTESQSEVLACGPPAMLEAVRTICAERDVPGQLALESGMACGFGACFGCAVPTRRGLVRLCLDGPVLAASALSSALTPGAGH